MKHLLSRARSRAPTEKEERVWICIAVATLKAREQSFRLETDRASLALSPVIHHPATMPGISKWINQNPSCLMASRFVRGTGVIIVAPNMSHAPVCLNNSQSNTSLVLFGHSNNYNYNDDDHWKISVLTSLWYLSCFFFSFVSRPTNVLQLTVEISSE